jgi:hypothetical protein
MELLTRLPGGAAIVFVLVIAIAAASFVGRRLETRQRVAPAPLAT